MWLRSLPRTAPLVADGWGGAGAGAVTLVCQGGRMWLGADFLRENGRGVAILGNPAERAPPKNRKTTDRGHFHELSTDPDHRYLHKFLTLISKGLSPSKEPDKLAEW